MMRVHLLIVFLLLGVSNTFAKKITERSQIKGHEAEITEIDLSNSGLSQFPLEILACKNLQVLNLSNNGIINIPTQFSELNRLKTLDLSSNQGLSYLDLDSIFAMAEFNLEHLNLGECEINFVPSSIGLQRELLDLDLSGNSIKSLPYQLIQLSKLNDFDLSDNKLEDISWQVSQWWGLERLNISNNPTLNSEALLFALSHTDKLERLEMSHLKEIPREFMYLNVKEMVITDSYIKEFPRREMSSKIARLSFVNCEFKNPNQVVETINKFVNPNFLSLQEVPRTSLIPFLQASVDSIDIQII